MASCFHQAQGCRVASHTDKQNIFIYLAGKKIEISNANDLFTYWEYQILWATMEAAIKNLSEQMSQVNLNLESLVEPIGKTQPWKQEIKATECQKWNYTKHLRQKRLSKESRTASIVLSRESWLSILSEDAECFSFFSNRTSDLSCHFTEKAESLSNFGHLISWTNVGTVNIYGIQVTSLT